MLWEWRSNTSGQVLKAAVKSRQMSTNPCLLFADGAAIYESNYERGFAAGEIRHWLLAKISANEMHYNAINLMLSSMIIFSFFRFY
jgi:hypothetical protein